MIDHFIFRALYVRFGCLTPGKLFVGALAGWVNKAREWRKGGVWVVIFGKSIIVSDAVHKLKWVGFIF